MGAIIEVREKIGAGNISVVGTDKIDLEKNDIEVKTYTVANLTFLDANVAIGGSEFICHIDVDTLSEAQLRSIMTNPDYQVKKLYDSATV